MCSSHAEASVEDLKPPQRPGLPSIQQPFGQQFKHLSAQRFTVCTTQASAQVLGMDEPLTPLGQELCSFDHSTVSVSNRVVENVAPVGAGIAARHGRSP